MLEPKQKSASLNHSLVQMPVRHDKDSAEALLSLSMALISLAEDILEQHVQTDEQLSRDSALMPGGTLGKHFRHIIESFHAFLFPLYLNPVQPPYVPEINYDNNKYQSRRLVARELKTCRKAMREISRDLQAWGNSCRRQGIVSCHEKDMNPAALGKEDSGDVCDGLSNEMRRKVNVVAITPTKQIAGSTVGRELWYVSLHAIHHFSMLRTIAVYELGLDLPIEFGTAPATLLQRGLSWKPPVSREEVKVVRTSKL
nr:hypothetical protein L203_02633 [Cryptococcus depauperatus CBS 7841]